MDGTARRGDGLTRSGGVSTCSLLRASLAAPWALPQEGLSLQELPVLCHRAAERAFLLVWYDMAEFPPFCITCTLCHIFHWCLFYPVSLSFSLTEMMRYLTKIQLGKCCFLAQLLPVHQILFQPFISRKFYSLPKGLPQLEGTCGTECSSSTSPKLIAGARPAAHREQKGRGDRHCSSCLSLLLDPGMCRLRRQMFVRPASCSVSPGTAKPGEEELGMAGPSFHPGQAGILTLHCTVHKPICQTASS